MASFRVRHSLSGRGYYTLALLKVNGKRLRGLVSGPLGSP
ncbi:hypothetical protein TCCBUS3UF1_3690 [Thermus sp. CCB_US3_UF1]|nr:hypothetical protein TCCBUS3UF1_3690 [Thermus sp. CCB_US3_UF1]